VGENLKLNIHRKGVDKKWIKNAMEREKYQNFCLIEYLENLYHIPPYMGVCETTNKRGKKKVIPNLIVLSTVFAQLSTEKEEKVWNC
jgi:hypothetical protein